MARSLRIEFPGAVYHVTSRGNARAETFADDTDRGAFLDLLGVCVDRFHWICHAYCLMGNHYHLLIETPEGNLARGLRELNGRYTQAFNRRHQRVGHLFQGRYKAILVDRDSYLLELCRYIVLNPVRAGMVARVEAYAWSSYAATCGDQAPAGGLHTDWILQQFAWTRAEAVRRYRDFVGEGMGVESPWKDLRGQVLLGDDAFLARMGREISQAGALHEVSRTQRYAHRPSLEVLFPVGETMEQTERDERLWRAHREYGYGQSELGRALNLHCSTISKALARHEKSQFKT
jgi:putative transposase